MPARWCRRLAAGRQAAPGRTGAASPAAGSAPSPSAAPRPPPATCPPAASAGRAPRPAVDARPRRRPASAASSVQPPAKTASRREQRPLRLGRAGRGSSPPSPAASAGARSAVRLPPVSSRKRSSRRASSCSRRQHPHPGRGQLEGQGDAVQPAADLRPPPARSRSVRAKAGLRRRGPGRRTAAPPRTAPAPRRARGAARRAAGRASEGTRQAVSPAMPSASRLVARTVRCGAGPQQGVGQPGAGVQQVLAVVQHQQQAPGPQVRPPAWPARGRPGSSRTPTAAATAWGTSAGSASGASSTSHTPSGYALQGVGRRLQRQAGLARPAGAGQGHQAVGAQQRRHLRQLPLPAHEAGQLQGQVVGQRVQGAQGRGSRRAGPGRRAGTPAPGAGRSFSRCSPRSRRPGARPGGRPAPGPPAASESTTCPPWAVASQPGAAVQGRPEVVGPLALHLPRVQPHPRPQGARPELAPVLPLQGQLPGQGRGDGVGGAGEGGVDRVPHRLEHHPPVRLHRPPQEGVVAARRRRGRRPGGPGAGGCCPPGR